MIYKIPLNCPSNSTGLLQVWLQCMRKDNEYLFKKTLDWQDTFLLKYQITVLDHKSHLVSNLSEVQKQLFKLVLPRSTQDDMRVLHRQKSMIPLRTVAVQLGSLLYGWEVCCCWKQCNNNKSSSGGGVTMLMAAVIIAVAISVVEVAVNQ